MNQHGKIDVAPIEQQPVPAVSKAPKKRWVEPVTALLMALATLGTAWCSYESAAWTRRSNARMNEFNALERKAGVLNVQGMQMASIQAAMFMQVLTAREEGKQQLADFYVNRFAPELRKAYDAWLAQKPFENPKADPHPFVPGLYQMPRAGEADQATADAAIRVQEARAAGNLSGQYLANTVLFAAVLFFANAAGKFEQRRVRIVAFIFAIAVFSYAVLRICMLPR